MSILPSPSKSVLPSVRVLGGWLTLVTVQVRFLVVLIVPSETVAATA